MSFVTCDHIESAHEFFQQHQHNVGVNSIVLRTPLEPNERLSQFIGQGAGVWLKREDQQRVKSYKIRGAFYAISEANKVSKKPTIVCASAGNHAQGVALSCAHLGNKGVIFMPEGTPEVKQVNTKKFGGQDVEVRIVGKNFDEAKAAAIDYAQSEGGVFIDPFDDPMVQAGQGTIALEIMTGVADSIHTILLPVGGGGLAAGVTTFIKSRYPGVEVIGIEQVGSDAMRTSLKRGERVIFKTIDLFAEGTAVMLPGSSTFDILKRYGVPVYAVGKNRLALTVHNLLKLDGIRVETSGGLSVAGLGGILEKVRGQNVACILSGANIDDAKMEEVRKRADCYLSRRRSYHFHRGTNSELFFDPLLDRLENNRHGIEWKVTNPSDSDYTIELWGAGEKTHLRLENFETNLIENGCQFDIEYLDIPEGNRVSTLRQPNEFKKYS